MKSAIYREGSRRTLVRRGMLALVAAGAAFLLFGIAFGYAPGLGMRSGGSNYYSSRGACTPPASLSGPIVKVAFRDMGMGQMMGGRFGGPMRLLVDRTTLAAGRMSIVATNLGWSTHELVVLPLANGQSAGQRITGADGRIDEAGSLAEASNNCGAGVGEGVKPGSVTWTTVTLTPGRYEFVCNLPNHYANGMHQEVLVTAS